VGELRSLPALDLPKETAGETPALPDSGVTTLRRDPEYTDHAADCSERLGNS